MTNINSALMEQILDLTQTEWKSDIHPDRQLDDFGACLEILERIFIDHPRPISAKSSKFKFALTAPLKMTQDDSTARKNDGERLRRLRKILGLTQKYVAEEMGMTERTIRNYETGRSAIPLKICRELLAKFGVDITTDDPNETPYLIQKQFNEIQRSHQCSKPVPARAAPQQIKPRLWARSRQIRADALAHNKYDLSPLRRAYNKTVHFIYLVATMTLVIQKIQRDLGGWQQHQAYHDALFIGSTALTVLLLLPMLQTIPWGMRRTYHTQDGLRVAKVHTKPRMWQIPRP